MNEQIPLNPAARADDPDDNSPLHVIAPDVVYRRLAIVNVAYVGPLGAGDGRWVLVDAGLHATSRFIVNGATGLFGANARPYAIVLTHGHFDHVGALLDLARRWDTPIYAHPLEHPFLNGSQAYPPPDPGVGGGLMARLSPLYPRGPIDVSRWLHALPEDHSVPGMPGWRWIPTPGHSPGHVSFWRESDRTLIAGDAFITTRQESAYAALTQQPEMHGPPRYYTPDWESAANSVRRLAELEPEVVLTGHGLPMRGEDTRVALHALADKFETVAVPEHGKYVRTPDSDADQISRRGA